MAEPSRKEGLPISTIRERKEPAEKAFTDFLTDAGFQGRENPDGIPEVSLAYREGEGIVLVQGIPLPSVDGEIQKRGPDRGDILYRVDYLEGGKAGRAVGCLGADSGNAPFTERIRDRADGTGDTEAGMRRLCGLLEMHLALCGLEELAAGELSPDRECAAWEGGRYLEANAAYYRKVLAYAGEARGALNMQAPPLLPPFPARGPFMAQWYESHS